MATLQQDPRFSDLLKWAEIADQGYLDANRQELLQGVFKFVEEALIRSEPHTSVVDRFSWSGTSFVDGLQDKYGAPEISAMGNVLQSIGTNFDRLFQMSEIGFDSGYHFFDFEGLVMPEVDWDFFDEDEAYDYAYADASRKRDLFAKDRKAMPRKTMGNQRSYPNRMGASINKILPQILRNLPNQLGENLRPEMVADWIDATGMRGELVATPDLQEIFTEESASPSGNDTSSILSQAILSNKGRAHRIKDIRLQPNALPALNSALNAVKHSQKMQPQLSKSSVTSTLRYHPVETGGAQVSRDIFEGTMLEIPAEYAADSQGSDTLGIRPMIATQGFEGDAQRLQPQSLAIEDIYMPAQSLPAMKSGMAEAAHQLGIATPSAASSFSLAKAESMLQGVTLGVPIVQPPASDTLFGADMTMVEAPAEESTFQETPTVTSLQTLLKGHEKVAQPPRALPLEQEILMNRAAGSQLAMTLGHSKPVEQAQESLSSPVTESLIQAMVEEREGPNALLKDVGTGMIRLPDTMLSRSELSGLTPDLLFQLMAQPEVASALSTKVGKDVSFWSRLQDRAESLNLSPTDVSEVWTLDASMLDLPSEAFEEFETVDTVSAPQEATKPETTVVQKSSDGLSPTVLREVLSRAAAKTGIRGNDLMPRMLKEVGARTEPKAIGRAFRKMLEANEISNLMGNAETARQFSTALRRELRSSGLSDTTLLEIPDMVAEAYPKDAVEQSSPTDVTEAAAPVVEASKEQMQTVQMAARVARRVGRAMRKLMTERFIGVPMTSIGWQDGANLEALDTMVQRVLDMPISEVEASESGQGPQSYRDLVASGEAGSSDLVQFSFNDAIEAGLMAEMEKGSKPTGVHTAPGISMGLSFSKALSKPGEVGERLRTLLASVESDSGTVVDLSAVLGWSDREQIQHGSEALDSFDSGAQAPPGGDWIREDTMEPVLPPAPAPESNAIPLGLTPTGTSMDLGRLSHTMLRPGEATSHEMNLVSPVSMAVAQSAHLKESSEQVGETAQDKAEASSEGSGDGAKKEVPNEILELLSHQIAKRISKRMKFEQDRSGRWDF